MRVEDMNVEQALEVVDQLKKTILVQSKDRDKSNVTIKELFEVVKNQKEVATATYQRVEELRLLNGNDIRKIKRQVMNRVNRLMLDYEGGKARKILFGNLQGYLFSRYNVNRYESLLKIHFISIQNDIDMWVPAGKVKEKLEPYSVTSEQIELIKNGE